MPKFFERFIHILTVLVLVGYCVWLLSSIKTGSVRERNAIIRWGAFDAIVGKLLYQLQSNSTGSDNTFDADYFTVIRNFYDYTACPSWFRLAVQEYCTGSPRDREIWKKQEEKFFRTLSRQSSDKIAETLFFLYEDAVGYEEAEYWPIARVNETVYRQREKFFGSKKMKIELQNAAEAELFFEEFDRYMDGFIGYVMRQNFEVEIPPVSPSDEHIFRCLEAFERTMNQALEGRPDGVSANFLYAAALLAKSYSVPETFLKKFRKRLLLMAEHSGDGAKQREIFQAFRKSPESAL